MAGMDRKFNTGATRDLDNSKLDFEGFISPRVWLRFAEYMHKNRFREGTDEIRASDNWQLGIPRDAYMKSLIRHLHDVWMHHDGHGRLAKEDIETALCAILFNAQGYLFEVLKEKDVQEERSDIIEKVRDAIKDANPHPWRQPVQLPPEPIPPFHNPQDWYNRRWAPIVPDPVMSGGSLQASSTPTAEEAAQREIPGRKSNYEDAFDVVGVHNDPGRNALGEPE